MSFWFITQSLQRTNTSDSAIAFPSGGLPDLSRALARDHLREWVRQLHAGQPPEHVDEITDYYWQLYTSLQRDDYVVTRIKPDSLALGEITGDYRFETHGEAAHHVWPVRWIAINMPLAAFALLRDMLLSRTVQEIPGGEARVLFRKYLPSWQTKGYVIFQWVSVVLLIAELVYFWPRNR